MQREDEPAPKVMERIFCRHPFEETKRCYVTASRIEQLLQPLWGPDGHAPMESLEQAREFCGQRLAQFRQDHLRPTNPTPYKRSMSDKYFQFFHDMWQKSAPVKDIS